MIYGHNSFLFPGDLEKEGEFALLKKGVFLKSNFLKVPHQGSRTSSTSEFLEAVNPSWGIVPTALQNRFGHPHKDVVERYEQKDVALFLTGNGPIEVISTGNEVCIFQGERKECGI